jgi:hypothetical protein
MYPLQATLAQKRREEDPPTFTGDIWFDRPSFQEATRLISMHLTPVEFLTADDCAPDEDPRYPPIVFTGKTFSTTMPLAVMRGRVRRTKDGVVRWSWVRVRPAEVIEVAELKVDIPDAAPRWTWMEVCVRLSLPCDHILVGSY